MPKIKNPICIDFDGVLATYTGWQGEDHLGKPLPGAKEFLKKLVSLDLDFSILTTRNAKKVREWFEKYELPMPKEITNQKKPSPVYIDDRSIKFTGDFKKLVQDLKEFNVYWKSKKIFEEYFK